MCKKVDIEDLLKSIGAASVETLENTIDMSSPSLIEYLIRDLMANSEESYLNRSNIQSKYSVAGLEIIFDYENNCHIIDYGISDDDRQVYL